MSFHKRPEEKLVRRAAKIWRQLIENPKFDNGDESMTGAIAVAMVTSIPTKTSPEAFDKFEEFIFQKMMTPLRNGYYPNLYLVVDYGPAKALRDAAEEAGLEIQFPWKTAVRVETNCVQVRSGDSSPCVSHYPLPDGRWLVTTLSGDDIDKVINHIMTGEPLGLTITE